MSSRAYEVTSMEVLPRLDAHSDVVIQLFFTYGTSEESLNGAVSLVAPQAGAPFLPLESVTKETALSWLMGVLRDEQKAELDEQLDAKIAEKSNVPYAYSWPVVDPGYDPSVGSPAE